MVALALLAATWLWVPAEISLKALWPTVVAIAGVFLLITTAGFYVSGFILPWDQRSFEITTAIVEGLKKIPILGDFLAGIITSVTPVGGEALGFFFTNHVIVLPLVIFVLLLFHFVMIRRQGIAEPL